MTASDTIGTIGAAGIGVVGSLFAIGLAHKAIDTTMKSTGLKPRRSSKKQSIFGF